MRINELMQISMDLFTCSICTPVGYRPALGDHLLKDLQICGRIS